MRRIGVEERRARLGLRHHLAAETRTDVVEAARDLVGLHGTDPATVYLAGRDRMLDPRAEVVDQALYEDRPLVRILGKHAIEQLLNRRWRIRAKHTQGRR